jgi:hypothetical protein
MKGKKGEWLMSLGKHKPFFRSLTGVDRYPVTALLLST